MLSFYGRVYNHPSHHSTNNDKFILPTLSSPLLPISITPLFEFLSLHFRCCCCPTYPLPHLSATVSARFTFLPSSSYRISYTTFSAIPLCPFRSPRHISFHHSHTLAQYFSPMVLFFTLLSLFRGVCSDILFSLQADLICTL